MEMAKSQNCVSSLPVPVKKIWLDLIPPRIEIFTWFAMMGKINSKAKLLSLNIIRPSEALCIFCNATIECADHLLLLCEFSAGIWNWWLNLWGLRWALPGSLKDAFDQWAISGRNSFLKKVWRAIFSIIIWSIWKERNSRIFDNKSCSIAQIQDLILTRLSWWISGWGDPFPYTAAEIICNPLCLAWKSSDGAIKGPTIPSPPKPWSPPRNATLKWNVDALVSSSQSMSAIGGVLRNHKGVFMCVFSSPIPPIEINSAEVLAIFRAIQISMRYENIRSNHLEIESDSMNAVRWCNEDKGGPWNLNFQLNFI